MVAKALLASLLPLVATLSCLDESGNPVDWYVTMKFHGSLDYAYVDSNTAVAPGQPFQLTGKSVGVSMLLRDSQAASQGYRHLVWYPILAGIVFRPQI